MRKDFLKFLPMLNCRMSAVVMSVASVQQLIPVSAFCPQTNMERTHHNEKETTRPQNQRDKMANWEKFPTIATEQIPHYRYRTNY